MKDDTVFWDVDTQFDFMLPEGRLYVPGAETIIETVSAARGFALENGYSIIASSDWHSADDDEISDAPDFKKTFPPHCMADEFGSERVGLLGELAIECIPMERMRSDDLRGLVAGDQFHVVIRKRELDVFSNPNTIRLVKLVKPKRAVVFGVALDCCVACAVRGLSKFGNVELCVLKDAVRGLGVKPESEILDEFKRTGVLVTEFGQLKESLQCG